MSSTKRITKKEQLRLESEAKYAAWKAGQNAAKQARQAEAFTAWSSEDLNAALHAAYHHIASADMDLAAGIQPRIDALTLALESRK